jgi:hypothetical protein
MNQLEARRLASAAKTLRQGPGGGWAEALQGRSWGPEQTIEERVRSIEIWLDSWVLPIMDEASKRYGAKK